MVHQNIRQRVVQPLKQFYQTDVFFIVSYDDERKNNQTVLKAPPDETDHLIQSFQPVRVLHYSLSDHLSDHRVVQSNRRNIPYVVPPSQCFNTIHPRVHFSHTLLRSRQCLNVIAEHERYHQLRYDWIYRIRPDVMYFHNVSLPFELRRDVMYITNWFANRSSSFDDLWKSEFPQRSVCGSPNISDHAFVAHRDIAERSFRAYDVRDNCRIYNLSDPTIASQIRTWMCYNDITYHVLPWMFTIVRDIGMCKFLDLMKHRYIAHRNVIHRCEQWYDTFMNTFNTSVVS